MEERVWQMIVQIPGLCYEGVLWVKWLARLRV